jgi:histidinol-phosphatase (PHP family)
LIPLLVDYHLHLAPDGVALGAAELSPAHVALYAESARERGIDHVCLTEHCHRFRQAAGLFDHPFWNESAQADLDAYVTAVRSNGPPVGCGIELDWIEGREEEIEALISARDFDLVLGSVHWLGGLAIDHPDYAIWDEMAADEVWRRYFAQVRAAAASGLFDVLAHLDLAKVFGHSASQSVIDSEHEQTADAIAAAGIAVEISTAGLRKAAGELYPAQDLLRALHRRGVPITLGSDGHVPEDLGRDYPRALEAAHACGYRTVSMFSGRERREAPLG